MRRLIILVLSVIFIDYALCAESVPVIHFITVDFPPYSYLTPDHRIEGIEVDIVRRMCEITGIQYTLSLQPFKRGYFRIQDFRTSGYDALFNFYKNPERLKEFVYTDPILENPIALFVRKNDDIVYEGDLKALKNYTFGVIRGYTYSPEFTTAVQDRWIIVEDTDSHEGNFKKLESGRIDIYPVEYYVGLYVIRKMGKTDAFRVLYPPIIHQWGHVGFDKDNPKAHLIPLLNHGLDRLKKSGEYQSIFEKHLF